jgi:hypothetical protein
MRSFFWILAILGPCADAAQLGKVVTDQAPIYEFPQKDAREIGKLRKGLSYPVSNLPTEGYFKMKTPSGDYGWVSGNDILVDGTHADGASKEIDGSAPPAPPPVEQTGAPDSEFWGDRTRIQLGLGLHALVYGGLSDYFGGTNSLNFGSGYSLEIQKKFFYLIYWAFRAEVMNGDTGVQKKDSTTTQRIKQYGIPLELGLILHPIHARKFRVGFGLYAGASVATYTSVQTVSSTADQTVKYNSIDPIGTASLQVTYGLSKAFAVFVDVAYRYQVTGPQPATSPELGSIPSFKIDYSGYYGTAGLEIRF